MRKIYSLVLMTAMLFVGTNAWATVHDAPQQEGDIAKVVVNNVTKFTTSVQEAIDEIGEDQSGTITLLAKAELSKTLVIPNVGRNTLTETQKVVKRKLQDITLNLNGFDIEADYACITLYKGKLRITGPGKIVRQGTVDRDGNWGRSAIVILGADGNCDQPLQDHSKTEWSTLIIDANVEVEATGIGKCYGITIQNTNSQPDADPYPTSTNLGYSTYHVTTDGSADCCNSAMPMTSSQGMTSGQYQQGSAYGVKLIISGTVHGRMRGINVVGHVNQHPGAMDDETKVNNKPVRNGSATYPYYVHYYPYIQTTSTADIYNVDTDIEDDGNGGIYAGGYTVMDLSGNIHGQTGILIKSGDVKLVDANIYSNSATIGANQGQYHGNVAGSGVFISSDEGYGGDINVAVTGDSKITGNGGAGIVDVVANPTTQPQVNNITIEGGTIEGGAGGAIVLTDETGNNTVVYGGNVEGTISKDGQTITVDSIAATSTHITTVTDPSTGKTTVVVSQGAAPTAYPNVYGNPKDSVKWVGTGADATETLAGDLTLKELEINESHAQTLTVPAGRTLTVEHLVMGTQAQIIVEAGATLIIDGAQGFVAPVATNLILKASETAQAKFLFNPDVSSNRQPNATVQVYTYAKQNSATSFTWQRLVSPLATVTNITSNGAGATLSPGDNIGTYRWWLEHWSYTNTAWTNITSFDQIKAFDCLQLTNNTRDGGITYSFVGYLQGTVDNSIKFNGVGYNFFGNSYTAPMSLTEIATTLDGTPADIDHSIWLWDRSGRYVPTNTFTIRESGYTGSLEIPALHSFIMKQVGASINMDLNYTNTVWNYNMGITPAPTRVNSNINAVRINVVSSEGDEDYVFLAEDADLTADYDNGVDASKLMQGGRINFYVMAENDNLSICGTNDIVGTMLSLETQNDINYTLTFSNVRGEVYALRDNMTNTVVLMNEGATYNFTAQPNATLEGRFQIVSRQEMPTAVETIEETIAPKAIYTVMGQYVGETTDWNNLPAGVYVVDGVKVIK